jgi:acetyl-CoA acyltransferase
VLDVVRTPFGRGRPTGALAPAHPVDLLAGVLEALATRTGVDPAEVDDVIVGCVQQVGEQAGNVGRHAVLAAGWPVTVPATTLDRKCGSFQQAVHFAAQAVGSGAQNIVVAAGVEMMSRIPMRTNRLDRDELGTRLRARYPQGLVRQGISAELIAARWRLPRPQLDRYALGSHRRAAAARDAGLLSRQILPVEFAGVTVNADEGIRDNTSLDALAALAPAFRADPIAERFPEIGWVVTAGNSSQVTDGASAALVVSEHALRRAGVQPRARVVATSVVGDDPLLMLAGVVPATERVLGRCGLTVERIDTFEVNEAFASVVLAWQAETKADPERVNPWGGAIAQGHPVGASGGRLLANLLGRLEEVGGRYGLWTMCESGGMANATVLERV